MQKLRKNYVSFPNETKKKIKDILLPKMKEKEKNKKGRKYENRKHNVLNSVLDSKLMLQIKIFFL